MRGGYTALRRRRFSWDTALGDISFQPCPEPMVSIVIPVYNQLRVTVACLRALHCNTPLDLIEVIVVDDASTDETSVALGAIPGLHLIQLDTNVGFLGATTAGISASSGRFVLLLNNDTEVQSGWLESLLETAASDDRIGAVGSKLLFGDGRLQEAGSTVWWDATAWNLGWRRHPDTPAFNVRRDVDYCSAAAMLLRRAAWDLVGGFDQRFAPAYYEDTDLCFALHAAGYRVVYDPFSVVIHHHSASHTSRRGQPAPPHSKLSMEVNRHIFAAKWGKELERHWPSGTASGLLGGRVDYRPRVLVCDEWVPRHDVDSGGLRMTWILWLLTELGCEVTLFPFNAIRHEPYTSDFLKRGVEVFYPPWRFEDLAAERRGLFDMALVSRPSVGERLLAEVRRAFPTATLVYDTVDLHHLRYERRAELLNSEGRTEVALMRDSEVRLIRASDIVSAVSEDEAAEIRSLAPGRPTVVLPNVHPTPTDSPPGPEERQGILFIGGFDHDPNVDAMIWFVDEVLPLIQAEAASMHLTILGSYPPPAVRRLASDQVAVTGYVPSVEGYFNSARVFVAPLRYGAGLKGKVGQAMSLGLPVVTTSIGAEGMNIVDGEHALVADNSANFATAVLKVARDGELWTRLSRAGAGLVNATLGPAAMRGRLTDLLSMAVRTRRPFGSGG